MYSTYALWISLCCLSTHAIDVQASGIDADTVRADFALDATAPRKKHHSTTHQLFLKPAEVSGVEHWYKADQNDYIYVGLLIDHGSVCGLIHSTSYNTNRIDRSILVGKDVGGRIEVEYASSYYSNQREIAKATIDHYDNHLEWNPTGPQLPSSWIWGQTTLSSLPNHYIPLTQDILNRCRLIRSKAAIEASDLYLEP